MADTTNTTNTFTSLLRNVLNNYFGNNNSNVAQGIANTDNYTPIDARTFLPSIGLPPIESNAITPTNPTPNNNLFSNFDEFRQLADYLRNQNREDTDYTVNRGIEIAREAARITQPHDLNLARIQQSGSLANSNAQVQTASINANAELEKKRMENNNDIAKEERDKRNKRIADMFSTAAKSNNDKINRTSDNSIKTYQDHKDQVHLQLTRQLELDRTRIDNENERNKHRNEMEKDNALYRNNIDVTRINADAQLGVARINAGAQLEATSTNANAQLGVASTNANAQLGIARMNNDAQLGTARTNANAQLGIARMNNDAQLGVARTSADAQLEASRNNADAQLGAARVNADAQLEATMTNANTQLGVARMNNEYGMQTTLLQGSQRQAELDKQGFIQLQLANIDRGQRGYDNMYSMLNQYTNRPRSNFAYWG